jgi:hypothetical protein
VHHDAARDVADAQHVGVAIRAREAEPARQVVAHHVAVEQRDGAAAGLDEACVQRARAWTCPIPTAR